MFAVKHAGRNRTIHCLGGMRSPLARTLADVAGSAEIQSAGLADACFAVFLSGYATQSHEMMKELPIG